MQLRTTRTTTPREDADAKVIRVKMKQSTRLAENEELLGDRNVAAFIKAVALAEGGGYDFKYGAIKGKRNDPWRFTDYSTHPGPGKGGTTTAAGMYQINIATWRDHGAKMGLTDFTPRTQDLIAVEILRSIGVIEKIKAGDVAGAMPRAAVKWAALPKGPGLTSAHPDQPFTTYEEFFRNYQAAGGSGK